MDTVYTILVVEDEPLHKNGTLAMLHSLRPLCHLLEAADGTQAVDILAKETVEVVITDIHMPGMSGLDFLHYLRESGYSTQVLILSGYSRFEYAQLAIRLGAFDYVLKPVSIDAMDELLCRMEDKHAQDALQKNTEQTMQSQLSIAYPFYLNSMLARWMQDLLSEKEMVTLHASLPAVTGLKVIACALRIYRCPDGYGDVALWDTLRLDVQQALHTLGDAFCFYDNGLSGPMTALLFLKGELAEARLFDRIMLVLEGVKKAYTHIADLEATLSDAFPVATDTPRDAARQASRRSVDQFYLGMPRPSGAQVDLMLTLHFSRMQVARMAEAMQPSFDQQSEETLMALVEELLMHGLPSPTNLKEALAALVEEAIELVGMMESPRSVRDSLMSVGSYEQTLRALCDWLYQVTASREEERHYTPAIKRSLHYIQANYARDISLKEIARLSFFSPNYFSLLFRKEVGVRFNDYLQQVRLRESLGMLESSDLYIYQIAQNVGYANAKYFCALFAHQFGMTPIEYRRLAGGAGNSSGESAR